MPKSKPKQKSDTKSVISSNASGLATAPAITVRYPLLWLAATVIVVYSPTFYMGLTDLDDGIVINTFHNYNENIHNLITSFFRSVYGTATDVLYRPVAADIMILNYQFSDHGQNLFAFHLVNVLLHLTAVLLLYKLFRKLGVRELIAFILTLLFAIHPALVQAVAWIPARNETILAIFIFSFLICTIDYVNGRKIRSLLLSVLFLLLSFFTKETAVFAAPVAFLLITLILKSKWLSRSDLILYGAWIGCFITWLTVRSFAIVQAGIQPSLLAHDFVHRLPLAIQYLGKIFLPFNLSVYPMQQDTVYYYGIIAVGILLTSIILHKKRNLNVIFAGLLIFLLFLIPAFLLPVAISDQTFEYRMYLPMFGIFLILPQTALLQNKLSDKQLLLSAISVAGLFIILNFRYQQNFDNPLAFWTQAVDTSPHSAEANMRLAARVTDEEKSKQLFLRAFALNPNEKHLNFIYGVMLQSKDSILESEKYLLAEKKIENCYECDLYLAQVAMKKNDKKGAIAYLESYLPNDSTNQVANDNLLVLYLDTDQDDKAKEHAKHMLHLGLVVPPSVRQHFQI